MQRMRSICGIGLLLGLLGTGASAQDCSFNSAQHTTPASRFIDHLDGTVTDAVTGLMWSVCSLGQTWSAEEGCDSPVAASDWYQALDAAAAATYAGREDWRLPNIKELASIVEWACSEPTANTEVFSFGTESGADLGYWSSSPAYDSEELLAWPVDFESGQIRARPRDRSLAVRLVRDP